MTVTFAMPCRTDEPAVAATLDHVQAAWAQGALGPPNLCVCVNGPGNAATPVVHTLQSWATQQGLPTELIETDPDSDGPARPLSAFAGMRILRTQRAGKARAWNLLRRVIGSAVIIWIDADVTFAADVPARLVRALDEDETATLASARTQPLVRPGFLERLQAIPYAFPFENLSPQLYASRSARLPLAIPEDLLDPERWLELIVGHERIVHAPDTIVWIGLAATLGDFFRQRVRLEQAKRQLACAYPGLSARGHTAPRPVMVRQHYSAPDLARLLAYLSLRSAAAAAGWWRHRRGQVEVAWQQATSTKVDG